MAAADSADRRPPRTAPGATAPARDREAQATADLTRDERRQGSTHAIDASTRGDEPSPARPSTPPRPYVVLVTVAAFVIVIAGVRALADIVGPVFLAIVIVVTIHPLRRLLARLHLRDWLSSVVVLVVAYLIIAALALAMVIAIGRLGALLPQYDADLNAHAADVGDWLQDRGVGGPQADAAVGALDPTRLASAATSIFTSVLGVVSSLALLVTVLFFIALDTPRTTQTLQGIAGRRGHLVDAVGSFAHSTRNYMAVSATFGFVIAIIDSVALYLLGVPGAFIWGVLSFVTNFVPNIGFVIGLIPPAILAGFEGGWPLMLAVIAIYCVVNFVLQSLIQPRVVGDVVGLTPTLTFVSLVFWAWVLGPLGGLLAVPLTLFVRAILVEADPAAWWLLPLMSGDPSAEHDT
jgi:AI-2 transport protein TqsA